MGARSPALWRKICCPVDFSDCAHEALEQAAALARLHQATLTLLHVYQHPVATLPQELWTSNRELAIELRDSLDIELGRWKHEAVTLGAGEVSAAVVEGTPHRAIVEFAARDSDVIVMGTHGLTGLKHLLLGSVAERVVRLSRCPVLTVSQRGKHEAGSHFSTAYAPSVAELMRQDVGFVFAHDAITTVARRLVDLEVSFLPVCDAAGRLVGGLTSSDVLRLIVAKDGRASEHHASEIMARNVPTCGPSDDARTVAVQLKRLAVRCMVVVDSDHMLRGLVTSAELDAHL